MIIAAILFIVIIWFVYTWQKTKDYPPGPFPLPIIGNLHLLRKDIHLSMDRLSKQYGGMFTLWMTNIPYIVITDMDLAKKVCMTRKFADRLPLYVGGVLYSRGSKDIIMGDYGKSLVLHRKLAHSAFKMFGDGMISLESRILESVNNLLQCCDKNANKIDYNLSSDVEHAFFNVMSSIVFGESMNKSDERFIRLRRAVFFMMQSGVTLSIINFYPFLRHFPNKELTETYKVIKERDDTLKKELDRAELNFQPCKQPDSYLEALLNAKYDMELEEGVGAVSNYLSRDHMEMNIFDMFLGGVETVSMTMMWSILYLMKWPEVQAKCHEHLDNVLGKPTGEVNTKVRLEHKKDLPYIVATIYETLRLASTLPFGVFHKAREDSEINGYTLKKGTPTMINIWTIHHDEKYHVDPDTFKPERFLDNEGNLLPPSKNRHFFAFSAGPRECIGQVLARSELFLFLSNLLHNFKFETSPLNGKLEINGNTKITHAPKPYNVVITRRTELC